jgi:hypothetical protein
LKNWNAFVKIACLHTAQSNVAIFEDAASDIGMEGALLHEVRSDLLDTVERVGGLTRDIAQEAAEALRSLGRNADAVLLTCSSLGPSIDGLQNRISVPVLRVDAALAENAIRSGGRIVVLCAAETTMGPTAEIFACAAEASQTSYQVCLVPGAWALFKAGESLAYFSSIAAAADEAYRDGASTVVLAQASMSGAVAFVRGGRKPLTSPAAGLAAAIAKIHGQSNRHGVSQ